MKKVLVLNPYLPTLGGGEKYMGYLCQYMEEYFKTGVSIDILVFNYNDINVEAENYVTIDDLNRQYNLKLSNTMIRKIRIVDAEKKKTFDTYISDLTKEYDLFVNFMIFSRLVSKAKKSIYLCMFPPRTRYMECNGNVIAKLKAKVADYLFVNSYTEVVTISEYTNHWFKTFWGKADKSEILYSPVFSEKELINRYDESKKENIIISVGRFFVDAHSKKQLEMVRFFVNHQEDFQDFEFHLVGAVSNYPKDLEYLENIKELASSINNIYIHENCAYNTLIDLYKKAKIFWHATGLGVDGDREPEKMEHFGITTVEAMSFGAVPVVINKGGQRETVEEGVNGYLWDREKMCVEKTKALIDDDNLRQRMAANSAERAKRFSIEEFYRNCKEIFDGIHI